MATLLVIGGSGFFGKSILDVYRRGLLQPWGVERIEVVSRNASALIRSNPELISEKFFLHDIDITLCRELPVADYVIHAAASTDARGYLLRPEIERKNIQLGVSNFCRLATIFLPKSKILYVSSGAVYGQQLEVLGHIQEDAILQPIDSLDHGKRDYAAAKRDAEYCVQELGKAGIKVAIARCFAFVGFYLPRNQHFAIGNFIEDGLQGRDVQVKAQHCVYRSYLYSDDLVLWLMKILDKASYACPIVNVGSDQAVLIHELAEKISKRFKVGVQLSRLNYSIVDRYVPSINKGLMMGCPKPLDLDGAIDMTLEKILESKS